ncbi:haloacid dehalogenase-like hydrolase [compost metagenome]
MKYKEYSQEIWNQIHEAIDKVFEKDDAPVAAFDADGTLWDTDLGETFFHYQIDNKLVSLPKDPWNHYQEMKQRNPQEAYLWLAQICKGQTLETVHNWAKSSLKAHHPVPVFSEQQKLIELLLSRGVKIYIITASVKWAVEPGTSFYGLSYDNVIGVETEVVNGVVSDKQKGFISYKEGKVEALLARTGGKAPFLASGNTMGDFQLLQSATHLGLAVSAASRDDKLFKTERELSENAQLHGWASHRFV